ncbi:MAG: hypothetical protein ABIG64_08835 [Candidatus Omnitrophota bacterium]
MFDKSFAEDLSEYFPLAIGNEWHYEQNSTDDLFIVKAEKAASNHFFNNQDIIKLVNSELSSIYLQKTINGIIFLGNSSVKSDFNFYNKKPLMFLPFNKKYYKYGIMEEETEIYMPENNSDNVAEIKLNVKVCGKENVFVKAGDFFNCYKLISTITIYNKINNFIYIFTEYGWYGKGVGKVKYVLKLSFLNQGQIDTQTQLFELKECFITSNH